MSDLTKPILVVPRAKFEELGVFQGFARRVGPYIAGIFHQGNFDFRPRGEVEDDPNWKQIIPYVVFQFRDTIFNYLRGKEIVEARLRNLRSIGVGGHMELDDFSDAATSHLDRYFNALYREAREEVGFEAYRDTDYVRPVGKNLPIIGLLNDESNLVGQVHLGIVHVVQVNNNDLTSREENTLLESNWATVEDLHANKGQYETWSQLCIDALFPAR